MSTSNLPVVNATVQVQRRIYNTGTKQSTLATQGSPVPALIKDISHWLRARGIAAEWPIKVVVDGTTDLRDGDQLTGWNPNGATVAPLLLIQHVSGPYTAPGMPVTFKSADAKMMPPGGS